MPQVVCQGDVQLLLRHRLECTVLRSWSTKEKNGCAPETHLVLNDVTIHRGAVPWVVLLRTCLCTLLSSHWRARYVSMCST